MNLESNDDIDNENFNSFDAGLQAGLGMDICRFVMGFDFSFGFIAVTPDDSPLDSIIANANNNTLQLYVGIKL